MIIILKLKIQNIFLKYSIVFNDRTILTAYSCFILIYVICVNSYNGEAFFMFIKFQNIFL